MSNYNTKVKVKRTGEVKEVYAHDNYFGHHQYGYVDGDKVYRENEVLHEKGKKEKCNCGYEEGHSRVCPLFVEPPNPIHKIGKCGAVMFGTKEGGHCAECGKKIVMEDNNCACTCHGIKQKTQVVECVHCEVDDFEREAMKNFDKEFPNHRNVFDGGDPFDSRRSAIKFWLSGILSRHEDHIYQELREKIEGVALETVGDSEKTRQQILSLLK